MNFNVSRVLPEKSFIISGVSYIGNPKSNTAMYISKKVERLLDCLYDVDECLIFAENGMNVDDNLRQKHGFMFTDAPQLKYAEFTQLFLSERNKIEAKIAKKTIENGIVISDDAIIGENAVIEPNCFIGPDTIIGNNAFLATGTVISHATIGNNFKSNEYAVIGSDGFTFAENEEGNKIRIPTLGRVIIGDNVEIGVHDNICCGSGGETIIEDYSKISAFVLIAHDVHIHKNVELTGGVIIGGFAEIGEKSFIGLNSTIKNRIKIGKNVIVGMGSNVTKGIEDNVTVAGNPAKIL